MNVGHGLDLVVPAANREPGRAGFAGPTARAEPPGPGRGPMIGTRGAGPDKPRARADRRPRPLGRGQPLILRFRPERASRILRLAFSRGIITLPFKISSGLALKMVECCWPSQWAGASRV